MQSKKWGLRERKFKNDFLRVMDRVGLGEANDIKFVELQQIYVEIMKNVLSQKTYLKFCKAVYA